MQNRDIAVKPVPGWIDPSDVDEIGDYYGLVIGIDEYGTEEWKLRCAITDAKAVASRFTEDCGSMMMGQPL